MEVRASLTLGDGWQPRRVVHAGRLLTWSVLEVLAEWTHPGWPQRTYGKPGPQRKYRLRVAGPLPWHPERSGEFILVATSYGDRPGTWWIRPG
jgi:hypothetical protein